MEETKKDEVKNVLRSEELSEIASIALDINATLEINAENATECLLPALIESASEGILLKLFPLILEKDLACSYTLIAIMNKFNEWRSEELLQLAMQVLHRHGRDEKIGQFHIFRPFIEMTGRIRASSNPEPLLLMYMDIMEPRMYLWFNDIEHILDIIEVGFRLGLHVRRRVAQLLNYFLKETRYSQGTLFFVKMFMAESDPENLFDLFKCIKGQSQLAEELEEKDLVPFLEKVQETFPKEFAENEFFLNKKPRV